MALAAVASVPVVSQWGVTGIWTFYANVRWKIIAGLLGLTLLYYLVPPLRNSDGLYRVARRLRLVLPDRVMGGDAAAESERGRETTSASADD